LSEEEELYTDDEIQQLEAAEARIADEVKRLESALANNTKKVTYIG